MTLSTGQNNTEHGGRHGAFTLVELILVMAIMVSVISLLTPKLSGFFGTRTAESEVGRFLSLTRLAQSRAVGQGVPMMVWVDPKTGTYGLKEEPGYNDNDPKAIDYTVADSLTMDIMRNTPPRASANSQTARIVSGQVRGSVNRTAAIHFLTDGTINTATSVGAVSFQHNQDPAIWVGPSTNWLSLEVQDKNTILANARRN